MFHALLVYFYSEEEYDILTLFGTTGVILCMYLQNTKVLLGQLVSKRQRSVDVGKYPKCGCQH